MRTKVRIGTYEHEQDGQEYTTGCYAVINGILCDDVTKIETSSEHAKLTAATITFTGDVGFTNEPKGDVDKSHETDDPMELANKLQQYCKGRGCDGCVFAGNSCRLATKYNPTHWELNND